MTGQHPHHGEGLAFPVLQRLAQVQKSPAFRHRGHAAVDGCPDGRAHALIAGKGFGVQFGISPRQIQPADIGRQLLVVQGAEKHRFRPRTAEGFDGFGIGEAERLVPGHRNAGHSLGIGPPGSAMVRGFEDLFKPGPVHRLQDGGCQGVDPAAQVDDLPRCVQAQVTALEFGFRHRGQISQHRQAGFLLQHGGQGAVQAGGTVVEQNGRNIAVGSKCLQSPHHGGQAQAGALGTQGEQHRNAQRVGQMPDGGPLGGAPYPVIKAHDPFAHGGAVAGAGVHVQAAHRGFTGQVQVQVVAFHSQHGTVKHGIDIIRPAFEGAGVVPAPFQGGQQGAGHHRLAAARVGGGYHTFNHRSSPLSKRWDSGP